MEVDYKLVVCQFGIPSAVHATFDLEKPSCYTTVPVQDTLKSDAGEIWHQGVTTNLSCD
jgi:hypothetical protein